MPNSKKELTRLSELLNLRKNDIDFYEQSVKVLEKRNKERFIPLTPTTLEVLHIHLNYLVEKSVIKSGKTLYL